MNCLIFEPDVTGHRLQHVRHLAGALLAIGCRVSVVMQTNALTRPEYKVHLGELEPYIEPRPTLAEYRPRESLIAARWRRVKELLGTIAASRPDWVYVPYADGITQAATLESLLLGGGPFQRVPIEAQIMRGKYGYPMTSMIEGFNASANRWLTRRSPWRVTHVLDPFILRALEPLPCADAFRLIPEPVEPLPAIDRVAARTALGVPTSGRYLAFVGGADPRKGIDLLLAAFTRARLAADDRLLFVGKMAPASRALVDERYDLLLRQRRIVVLDRYVTDHELDCGFLAADVVAVTHPRQIGSSGTLVRAAAAGRPVLASDFGWVAWATDVLGLGATVNVSDAAAYARAIERAFASCSDYRPTAAAERFCRYHTIANQKSHWVATIGRDRGLSLGALGERTDWGWVMEAVDPARRIRVCSTTV
jgi:glycosyltransferase involved in cell wall biosynthesis